MSGANAGMSPEMVVADRLHSAAIHLLRRLRRQDPASGLSAARLSALSVIVYGGSPTMGELATAEQVQLPTMSRLVASLERNGLVTREHDPADRRIVRVAPTRRGSHRLCECRERRVNALAADLRSLPAHDLDVLAEAAAVLNRVLETSTSGWSPEDR